MRCSKRKTAANAVAASAVFQTRKKIFPKKNLTNAAQHATMVHMTERTAPMLPTGDRTSVPRLALLQQAAAPVDKSAGGGLA